MSVANQTVFERVQKVIVEQLGVESEQVVSGANFVNDLGADSLGKVEIIMALEEEFGDNELDIPDEEAEELSTVGDAVKYIESQLN